MDTLRYTFWLFDQTLSGLFYFKYLTIGIFSFLPISAFLGTPFRDKKTKKLLSFAIPILLSPAFILLLGGLLRGKAEPIGVVWPVYVLYAFFVLQIIGLIYFVWISAGNRIRAFFISLFSIYLSSWAMFVATMAVTNDWL